MRFQPSPSAALPPVVRAIALAALVLALLAALALGLAPLHAQEITVSGNCPLAERTFAVGDTLTFSYQQPLAELLDYAPSYLPCQDATFTANGVTGKPPLTLSWLLDGTTSYSGNPLTLNTATIPAGSHTLTFRATNAYGTATKSVPFSVQPLSFLLAPAYENLGANTARFQANTSGATEWRWTWGDGTSTGWLAGCAGYAPTRQYAAPGTYTVQVSARNCRDAAIQQNFAVTVTQTLAARVLTFLAACPYTFCIFDAGTPIRFDQTFAGAPTVYRYDWNGDGAFEQVSSTPVTSHTYPASGLFTPRLQVADAATTHTLDHQGGAIFIQDPLPTPPPAAPTGLTLDVVGQEYAPPTVPPPTDVFQLLALIVRLRWTDQASDETGFNVYQSVDGGADQLLAVLPRDTVSSANFRTAAGHLYRFRVTAYGPGGESQPTTPVTMDLRP
jgi:PKD repeat protein